MSVNQFATHMRKNPTPAEQIIADGIARSRHARDFDCQVVIRVKRRKYILDFFWKPGRIAIELDGSHHLQPEQGGYDLIREDDLKCRGIKVWRLLNRDVIADPKRAVSDLFCELYPG